MKIIPGQHSKKRILLLLTAIFLALGSVVCLSSEKAKAQTNKKTTEKIDHFIQSKILKKQH